MNPETNNFEPEGVVDTRTEIPMIDTRNEFRKFHDDLDKTRRGHMLYRSYDNIIGWRGQLREGDPGYKEDGDNRIDPVFKPYVRTSEKIMSRRKAQRLGVYVSPWS